MAITDLIAIVLVGLVLVGVVIFVVRLVGGIAARGKQNRAFLDRAIAASDLHHGAVATITFQPAPGAPHALWLDLALAGPSEETGFQLGLTVRVGADALIDGTFDVTFDSEHDARGLPPAHGTIALNTQVAAVLGSDRITTVLRPFRFDAPAVPTRAEILVRFTPRPGTTVTRARALVTVPDVPA